MGSEWASFDRREELTLVGNEDLAVGMARQRRVNPLMEPAQILHRANLGVGWGSWTDNGDMMGGLQVEYLNLPLPCTKKKFGIIMCPATYNTAAINDPMLAV